MYHVRLRVSGAKESFAKESREGTISLLESRQLFGATFVHQSDFNSSGAIPKLQIFEVFLF